MWGVGGGGGTIFYMLLWLSSKQSNASITFDGAIVKQRSHLRCLGSLSTECQPTKKCVETTSLRCKKCLSDLKAMDAKGIEQCHLFLLYQSVVLIVIDYGLSLTTVAVPERRAGQY